MEYLHHFPVFYFINRILRLHKTKTEPPVRKRKATRWVPSGTPTNRYVHGEPAVANPLGSFPCFISPVIRVKLRLLPVAVLVPAVHKAEILGF